MNTIAEIWSTFQRGVVGTFHELCRKCRRRVPPSSMSVARTGETWMPSGRQSWLLKEPKWFAAVLAFAVLALVEVLSWEASKWPLCLVVSKYQSSVGQPGQAPCATFSEAVMQLIGFLWDQADPNAVTAFAAIVIAISTWTLWRSSEKM